MSTGRVALCDPNHGLCLGNCWPSPLTPQGVVLAVTPDTQSSVASAVVLAKGGRGAGGNGCHGSDEKDSNALADK